MQTRRKLAFVVFLVLAAALMTRAVVAETHREPALHCTLELPANWVAMPAIEIKVINAKNRLMAPGQDVHFTTGFRPRGVAAGSFPYILVELYKTGATSYEQIEQVFAKATPGGVIQSEGELPELIKEAKVGSVVLNRASNRIVNRLSMNAAEVGKIQEVTVGHLGAEGIVYLHCYALDQDFDNRLSDFVKINDAFQFDAGYAFLPGTGATRSIMTAAIVVGLGGVVIGLAVFLKRKLKN